MSDQPARSSKDPKKEKAALRVLVVDDNDDNRNLLLRRLKSKGYEVDLAADGPSALEACANTKYDAILLDVMMPGMSGIEVLEKLREKHTKTELSVIMATAKNDSNSVVDALKRGANDYVTKPIDFPILLARLETQLAMKAEASEAVERATATVDVTFGIAPGTILCERYEILEKRGEGGFAVVYRARQLSTKRDVALKHLRPDVLGAPGDNVQLERFERESKLIGELNHPNVVRLIDSGSMSVRPVSSPSKPPKEQDNAAPKTRDDSPAAAAAAAAAAGASGSPSQTRRRDLEQETLSVPYIVMELLCGESLGELIEREAPLDCARSIDLILPVLSALSAAHERGVVHRDVKPNNIMLTTDDRGEIEPKVLDFGIAKLTSGVHDTTRDLTISASLIGTPQYMPPEQAFGKKDLDGRVDQFSAAAVLYQMLTGHSPYGGESLFELVSKVLAGEYTPLADERPDLPAELVAVISKALSTNREHRYPSMRTFGRALVPYASDRAARKWTDHFNVDEMASTVEPDFPSTATAAAAVVMNVDRSERQPAAIAGTEATLESPAGGPTDETVQLVGSQKVEIVRARARAGAPTGPAVPAHTVVNTLESAPQVKAAVVVEPPPPTMKSEPPVTAAKEEAEHDDETTNADKDDDDDDQREQAISAPKVKSLMPAVPAETKGTSWERMALIAIAISIAFYLLARYVF